jgi:outer membrane scaffolding protein for murein synthesis (MipA/OmpV family)
LASPAADEGLKDVGFDLGILCQFNQNWGGRLLGGYKLLLNDADESSPVTNEGSQHQLFGGFWWSTRFNRQLSADIGLESYRFYSG